jgi:hypothetical protein
MRVLGATGFGVVATDPAAEPCGWAPGAAVAAGAAGIAVGSSVFVAQPLIKMARRAKIAMCER